MSEREDLESLLLSAKEVARLLGNVNVVTVREWWDKGLLPPPIKLGKRLLFWRRTDIEAHIAGHQVEDRSIRYRSPSPLSMPAAVPAERIETSVKHEVAAQLEALEARIAALEGRADTHQPPPAPWEGAAEIAATVAELSGVGDQKIQQLAAEIAGRKFRPPTIATVLQHVADGCSAIEAVERAGLPENAVGSARIWIRKARSAGVLP